MKTNINLLIALFFALTCGFCSCGQTDRDTTPPEIRLNKPAEGAVLKIGSGACLDMDLSDNEALLSYKVEIHDAFDGHGHSRAEQGETKPFFFEKTWDDAAGLKNKHVHSHDVVIWPNATPGKYHLMVFCTDAAKNESHVARTIYLSHDGEGHDHDHDHDEHENHDDHDHR